MLESLNKIHEAEQDILKDKKQKEQEIENLKLFYAQHKKEEQARLNNLATEQESQWLEQQERTLLLRKKELSFEMEESKQMLARNFESNQERQVASLIKEVKKIYGCF